MPREAETQKSQTGGEGTYGEIVTSSALIGSSSILNIAIGIVRTKVMALLLGPAGFGLFGICWSIASLFECVAGMGINSSGVREIAHATGSEDKEQIARTTIVLRRLSVVLGLLGAALVAIFSRQIAKFTFGDDRFAGSVALLSLAVLFQIVSNAQGALIQGMRQIGDLAKMGVFGALWGTAIGITLVYFCREGGVAPSIVGVSLMSLFASWWYSRRIQVRPLRLTSAQVRDEASGLLKLGLAFMSSYLMEVGTSYLVRIIVLRRFGLGAA
jgi:antigen flippase